MSLAPASHRRTPIEKETTRMITFAIVCLGFIAREGCDLLLTLQIDVAAGVLLTNVGLG
jgi:hypothetical protein